MRYTDAGLPFGNGCCHWPDCCDPPNLPGRSGMPKVLFCRRSGSPLSTDGLRSRSSKRPKRSGEGARRSKRPFSPLPSRGSRLNRQASGPRDGDEEPRSPVLS
eukprot:Skav229203  [mRNA]  locus=scaffold2439:46346:46654:- [translate_table: standard]